jgi:hypothetical protein
MKFKKFSMKENLQTKSPLYNRSSQKTPSICFLNERILSYSALQSHLNVEQGSCRLLCCKYLNLEIKPCGLGSIVQDMEAVRQYCSDFSVHTLKPLQPLLHRAYETMGVAASVVYNVQKLFYKRESSDSKSTS